MSDIIAFVKAHLADLLTIVTSVIAAASVIANFTKTDSDNKVIAAISKFIALLAGNVKVDSLKK